MERLKEIERGKSMKKPYKNTDLHPTKCCQSCGDRLKMNLLHKKPNATQDFKCYYPAEIKRRNIGSRKERGI